MKKNNKDLFITEISEEDFRKLDLVAYRRVSHDFMNWTETRLNDVLDKNIAYCLEQAYESDFESLKCPVTVAIHKANSADADDYYLDKFMNRFTGAQTYQIGFGIKHLYSTRDYYEDKEDYWRVLKRETKAIYRVHLDKKWLKMFKLKHRTEKMPWNLAFGGSEESNNWELWVSFDYDEELKGWVETSKYKVIHDLKYGSHLHIPVDANGEEIKHK